MVHEIRLRTRDRADEGGEGALPRVCGEAMMKIRVKRYSSFHIIK